MPNPHPISHLKPDSGAKGNMTQVLTRKWYRNTLLAIFRGEIKCTSTQLNALVKFADNRGWFPPQRPKQVALKDKSKKAKPQASVDVLNRLAWFNSAIIPAPNPQPNDCNPNIAPNFS